MSYYKTCKTPTVLFNQCFLLAHPSEAPEEQYDPRSLFERLQEQKDKKQEEYEEQFKFSESNSLRGKCSLSCRLHISSGFQFILFHFTSTKWKSLWPSFMVITVLKLNSPWAWSYIHPNNTSISARMLFFFF